MDIAKLLEQDIRRIQVHDSVIIGIRPISTLNAPEYDIVADYKRGVVIVVKNPPIPDGYLSTWVIPIANCKAITYYGENERRLSKSGDFSAEELQLRQSTIRNLRSSLFSKQQDFIDDPAKLKVALCTRRAGKSYGCAGIYMAITCVENPGCNCLYMATTRESAKKIILKDILKVIDKSTN